MADWIDSILPAPAQVNLLTSAMPFPEADRPYARWSLGVQMRNLGGLRTQTSRLVGCPADLTAYDAPEQDCATFYPLKTDLPHGIRGKVDDEGRYRVEADASLRSRIAYGAAREFWTGALTLSDSLQGSARLATAVAQKPLAAIASGLAAYEDCTQGAGPAWIHAPSVLKPYLETNGFFERDGDRYVTNSGDIIVFGPGYPNNAGAWGPRDPDLRPETLGWDEGDPTAYDADTQAWIDSAESASAGQVWLYVTGKVEATDPHYLKPDTAKEQRHSRMNEFLATARAVTIVRFDPSCVFASLVTIPGNV